MKTTIQLLQWFVCVTCVVVQVKAQDNDECYSCSYTFAGDGSINRECVTAPSETGLAPVPCDFAQGRYCYIVAGYRLADSSFLQSVVRNCYAANQYESGCTAGNERCVYKCQSSLCNFENGDLKEWMTTKDNGVTALSSGSLQVFMTLLTMISFTLLLPV